jgi:hypothetical protein
MLLRACVALRGLGQALERFRTDGGFRRRWRAGGWREPQGRGLPRHCRRVSGAAILSVCGGRGGNAAGDRVQTAPNSHMRRNGPGQSARLTFGQSFHADRHHPDPPDDCPRHGGVDPNSKVRGRRPWHGRRRWRRSRRLPVEPWNRKRPDPHHRDPGRTVPMARYVFITGGVVSSLGKGSPRRRSARCCRRAATRSACASSTPISTSIRAR